MPRPQGHTVAFPAGVYDQEAGSLCQEDTACCPHHLCSPAPCENGPHGDPLIAALPASSLLPSRQPQPHPHHPPQPLCAPGPQRRGGGANPHSRLLLHRAPSSPPGGSSQQVSTFLTSWGLHSVEPKDKSHCGWGSKCRGEITSGTVVRMSTGGASLVAQGWSLPVDAGGTGSIPGLGRSHMPRSS